MDKKILKWLYDIQNAIFEIERDLEIIGEAVNRILREDPIFLLTMQEK
ncbi:hypothetical protein [Mesohalobacter salilacus]